MRTKEIWHDLDRFPSHLAIAMNHTPVRIVELNKDFNSVRDCAEFLGVLPTCLSRVLTGARKGQRIHGYHVEYV